MVRIIVQKHKAGTPYFGAHYHVGIVSTALQFAVVNGECRHAPGFKSPRAWGAMKVAILSPVYNDWKSAGLLVEDAGRVFSGDSSIDIVHVFVDDGSTDVEGMLDSGENIRIVQLQHNVGHQRAIGIGLCFIHDVFSVDKVVVMDSDGEDRVSDIPALLEESSKAADEIVFAARRSRSEGRAFVAGYCLYKQ